MQAAAWSGCRRPDGGPLTALRSSVCIGEDTAVTDGAAAAAMHFVAPRTPSTSSKQRVIIMPCTAAGSRHKSEGQRKRRSLT